MEGMKYRGGADVSGFNRSAMPTVRGAICFNSSTHLPPCSEISTENPVMLPPGRARLAPKPLEIASATITNTMGIVRVSWARARVTAVV